MTSGYDGLFRIGSLAFRLRTTDRHDAEVLAVMFKQPLNVADAPDDLAVSDTLEIVDQEPGDDRPVPADGLLLLRSTGRLTIRSELVAATLEMSGATWRGRLEVRHGRKSDPFYPVHLSIVLHRLLLELGCAYLHAAAVTVDGRTFVFIGEKAAGKSSIAMALGRAGATILSDDHVLLRCEASAYSVSGCEAYARVTAETEAIVFADPLPMQAENFAGTLKKEFVVRDFFASRPHEDAPVSGVLFPSVGQQLRLTSRNPRQAALDLIQRTRRSYRPQDADDIRTLLDFWTGLAQTVPVWDLELSRSVGDLKHLGTLLETGPSA